MLIAIVSDFKKTKKTLMLYVSIGVFGWCLPPWQEISFLSCVVSVLDLRNNPGGVFEEAIAMAVSILYPPYELNGYGSLRLSLWEF